MIPPMGLWATFPLPAARKGISAERLILLEGLTEWERYKEDFNFCKLGLRLLKLHSWSAGFEALKPQQEILCIMNFPLPHIHLSSKHLTQGSCGVFPSTLSKCILKFSISLFYCLSSGSSNCLSLGPSCLSLGLDKVLGFRFLIKANLLELPWSHGGKLGTMVCLLSQPLLGHSDPAAWHPVSEWQAHSQLPLQLLALEQTSLRLTPLWQGHGSTLPQQLCKWRGGSRVGEEQGASGQGDTLSGLQSRPWSQLRKEKWRDVLSKMSCCCPAVFCGRPSVHYSHISHSIKTEERPPRAFKCGICGSCRKVPRSSIIILFIPSHCCFSVKKTTIVPIPIPAQSYIPSRTHFSVLPQMAQKIMCRCISGE